LARCPYAAVNCGWKKKMKFLFEKLCEREIEKDGWKCVRGKGPEAFDIL
jgi:predicted RNA binding protein YcfA (HicA-like mRNA interferase family)